MAADVRLVLKAIRVMLGPSGLAPLALHQLAAWQQVAAGWQLRLDHGHLRCADCEGPVLAVADAHGRPYRITGQMITDATVMHLRAASCRDGASRAIVAGETPGDMLLWGSHMSPGVAPKGDDANA